MLVVTTYIYFIPRYRLSSKVVKMFQNVSLKHSICWSPTEQEYQNECDIFSSMPAMDKR